MAGGGGGANSGEGGRRCKHWSPGGGDPRCATGLSAWFIILCGLYRLTLSRPSSRREHVRGLMLLVITNSSSYYTSHAWRITKGYPVSVPGEYRFGGCHWRSSTGAGGGVGMGGAREGARCWGRELEVSCLKKGGKPPRT